MAIDYSFDPEHALVHLQACDPTLGRIIDRVGPFTLEPAVQGFDALVDAIVSQQISVKASIAILRRLTEHVGSLTPTALLAHTPESLREAGLSNQKARYILDLAGKVHRGLLDLALLSQLDDEAIIEQLVQVKGIGRWTAEMYLIFALLRPDVLPVDDLGIRQAVQRAYRLDELPKGPRIRDIAEPWQPYRSVGSWYLWRSLALPGEFFVS